MRKAILFIIAALPSCNQQAALQTSDVVGAFEFNGCPTIFIDQKTIKSGNESLQYDIINIKGDQYLRVPRSVYISQAGACSIRFGNVSSIISIKVDEGVVRGILLPDLEGRQSLFFSKRKI